MNKKQFSLFDQWLEINGFLLEELDDDSLNFVYMQIEEGTPIEDIDYFG